MQNYTRSAAAAALLTTALLSGCGGESTERPAVNRDPGQMAFLRCEACHSIAEGGAHKLGPNLYGIFDEPAASRPGFDRYTQALLNSGLTWDRATLTAWLEAPARLVPGTSMVYHNTLSAEQLSALIDYLAAHTPQ